jgi:cathepsin B
MKVFASTVAVAAAGSAHLKWTDCGDADTFVTIVGLDPEDIALPGKTSLTGSGFLSADEAGGQFKFTAKAAGIQVLSGGGDLCEDNVITLPDGAGQITFHALDCPTAAGQIDVKLDLDLADSVANDLINIQLSALSTSGDKLMCMEIETNGMTEFEKIAHEANLKATTWTAEAPKRFKSTDDVKQLLGAILPGEPNFKDLPEQTKFSTIQVPENFDSAENWPQCTNIANVRDQSACGSCWAFGSVSSFESRACIATGKDVKYSPEQTASCFTFFGDGCGGGFNVWDDFQSTGVVTGGDFYDEEGSTCARYTLQPCAHHVPADEKYPACPSGEYVESNCPSSCENGYGKSFSADKLHAASTYSIRGESNMMAELVENGPMYVSFTVYDDFPAYKSGVYKATSSKQLGGHAVTLVGYGELDGEKYWKIKNSWNEHWGDNGHFLIARGNNECGIEGNAGAGTIATDTVV